jgi:hypothetical protein
VNTFDELDMTEPIAEQTGEVKKLRGPSLNVRAQQHQLIYGANQPF